MLCKTMHFPCVAPDDRRSLVAAVVRRDGGPCNRVVAFERYADACEALEQARRGPLQVVVGPTLRFDIAQIERGVPTTVWTASAMDVANRGVLNFRLDVCSLSGVPGVMEVVTSYAIVIDNPDQDAMRLNLHVCWEM